MSVCVCVWPVTLYWVVTVSVVVYWSELVVVIYLFHVVVVSLPCWCVRHASNRRENPFGFLCGVFDWSCLACSYVLSAFGPFNGQSSSIEHKLKGKRKWMDLNGYLSMAWFEYCCPMVTLCFTFPLFSFFYSLDGKKEFTQTDAPSTLTTVRRLRLRALRLFHACIWSCVSYFICLSPELLFIVCSCCSAATDFSLSATTKHLIHYSRKSVDRSCCLKCIA